MAAPNETPKSCLVLAPIDKDGSDIRRRSDDMLKYIIKPVTLDCGYRAIRADEISEPGIITHQIFQHILEDDLVIADLTGGNPNVFYELALRHAIGKPWVQIVQSRGPLPFDVAPARTINFIDEMSSVESCKQELAKQIKAAEQNSNGVESPISVAIDILQFRKSNNFIEKSNAEILSMLQDLRGEFVKNFREQSERISELQSLLTTNVRDDLADQASSTRIMQSTGSSTPKEMEWDNFIRQLGYFNRRNLIEIIDDLIGQSMAHMPYSPYNITQHTPHTYASHNYASHYSAHPGIKISTNPIGDYEIEFYSYTITIGKDDLRNFRDYVERRGVYL